VLIFGLGGGVSFYEGILHVRTRPPLEDPTWNYVVLACAAVFEGISFSGGLAPVHAPAQGHDDTWQALRSSKDPTTYTVVAEDSAALVGLAIAALGRLPQPRSSTCRSSTARPPSLIGVLLAGVAMLLIRESRGLLVGEGVRPALAREIREMATSRGSVHRAAPCCRCTSVPRKSWSPSTSTCSPSCPAATLPRPCSASSSACGSAARRSRGSTSK
jgi:divalent metal cation (Fe/Co/Zn/Cd) transporter